MEGILLVRVLVGRRLDLQLSLAVWSLRFVAVPVPFVSPFAKEAAWAVLCAESRVLQWVLCVGALHPAGSRRGHRPFQVEDMSFLQGVHGPDMWSVSVLEP